MPRKRPSALDALGDVAPPSKPDKQQDATPASKKRSSAHPYGKPATYRLPETLILRLKGIAQSERVKISELVTFALQGFVQDYEGGNVDLPKSESTYKIDV